MQRHHLIAISLSTLAHAAILVAIATAGLWLWDDARSLPGETIAVSIVGGGNGGTGGTPAPQVRAPAKPKSAPPPQEKTASKELATSTSNTTTTSPVEDATTSSGSRSSGSPGIGGGTGTATGTGNSVLAQIWRRINAAKYYPESARRMGLTGAPRVSFSIRSDGTAEDIRVTTSSGETLLDDAAIETVKRASPLPLYDGPITLAVKYSLNR